MPKRKKCVCVLIDTRLIRPNHDDYTKWCEENNKPVRLARSVAYKKWVVAEKVRRVKPMLERFKERFTTPVILTGTISSLRGTFNIKPMFIESEIRRDKSIRVPSLYKAICKCIKGMNDFRITLEEGYMHLTGFHIEGENHFTIMKIALHDCEVARRMMVDLKLTYVWKNWKGYFNVRDIYNDLDSMAKYLSFMHAHTEKKFSLPEEKKETRGRPRKYFVNRIPQWNK